MALWSTRGRGSTRTLADTHIFFQRGRPSWAAALCVLLCVRLRVAIVTLDVAFDVGGVRYPNSRRWTQ